MWHMRIEHVTWGPYSEGIRPATVTYHDGSYKTLTSWEDLASLQEAIKAQNKAAQRDDSINTVERHPYDLTMEQWDEQRIKPEDWQHYESNTFFIPLRPGVRFKVLYERTCDISHGLFVDDAMMSIGLNPFDLHAEETANAVVERMADYLSYTQLQAMVAAMTKELRKQEDYVTELEIKNKLQGR